jgi:hypothetical protein
MLTNILFVSQWHINRMSWMGFKKWKINFNNMMVANERNLIFVKWKDLAEDPLTVTQLYKIYDPWNRLREMHWRITLFATTQSNRDVIWVAVNNNDVNNIWRLVFKLNPAYIDPNPILVWFYWNNFFATNKWLMLWVTPPTWTHTTSITNVNWAASQTWYFWFWYWVTSNAATITTAQFPLFRINHFWQVLINNYWTNMPIRVVWNSSVPCPWLNCSTMLWHAWTEFLWNETVITESQFPVTTAWIPMFSNIHVKIESNGRYASWYITATVLTNANFWWLTSLMQLWTNAVNMLSPTFLRKMYDCKNLWRQCELTIMWFDTYVDYQDWTFPIKTVRFNYAANIISTNIGGLNMYAWSKICILLE